METLRRNLSARSSSISTPGIYTASTRTARGSGFRTRRDGAGGEKGDGSMAESILPAPSPPAEGTKRSRLAARAIVGGLVSQVPRCIYYRLHSLQRVLRPKQSPASTVSQQANEKKTPESGRQKIGKSDGRSDPACTTPRAALADCCVKWLSRVDNVISNVLRPDRMNTWGRSHSSGVAALLKCCAQQTRALKGRNHQPAHPKRERLGNHACNHGGT